MKSNQNALGKHKTHIDRYLTDRIVRNKQHCNQIYASALSYGILVNPKVCSRCNSTNRIDGHHFKGYDYPLEVEWLCSKCHHQDPKFREKQRLNGLRIAKVLGTEGRKAVANKIRETRRINGTTTIVGHNGGPGSEGAKQGWITSRKNGTDHNCGGGTRQAALRGWETRRKNRTSV